MGKLIVVILGIATLAGAAYVATRPSTEGGLGPDKVAGQDPSERLQNVREAAKEIEAEQQKHLDDTFNQAAGQPR
jgi:hypothetical protein